jgi:hypothetical protein
MACAELIRRNATQWGLVRVGRVRPAHSMVSRLVSLKVKGHG